MSTDQSTSNLLAELRTLYDEGRIARASLDELEEIVRMAITGIDETMMAETADEDRARRERWQRLLDQLPLI